MKLPVNTLKKTLRERKPAIGLWSSLSSHVSVEVLAWSGFDFLLLDTEHSPNELPMVHAQLQALNGSPTAAVVRPAWNDAVVIKRLLDIGASSLLIPMVQNADEARAAVAATRYPPRGIRGVASSTRATRYGRITDYFDRIDDELLVIAQLETREALGNLEAIAAVDGIDGLFIGPSDLSADMGLLGRSGDAAVRAAIDDGFSRILKAGKFAGILTPDEAWARHCLEVGATFVAVGNDVSLLARQSEALAARFR
ncbi:MAG: HpcH/HpaI aldolase/citrate lyase family protein [Lautropia sp.]